MSNQCWKVVRPHVAMITFRKGGLNRAPSEIGAASVPSARPGAAMPNAVSRATGPNVTQLPIIEDFQLPLRFRRQPPGDKEMEYINRGGPE